MGAAEVTARSGTASPRCRCGHAKPRHDLPGFDGECVAEGCRCHLFSVVQIAAVSTAAVPAHNPASGALTTVEQVVSIARSLGTRRMLLTVARVDHLVAELRALIMADRAKARAEAAREQIDAIDTESKATAKAHKPVGHLPCGHPGCVRTFTSGQGVALHRRRVHEGFSPGRKPASTTQPEGETA